MKRSCVLIGVLLWVWSMELPWAYGNYVRNSGFESGYAAWSFKDTGMGGDGGIVNMSTLNPNDCFPIDTEHGNCFFYSNGLTAYQSLVDESGSPMLLQAGKIYSVGAETGITIGLGGWPDDIFFARANIARSVKLFVMNDAGEWVTLYSVTMPDWNSKDQAGTWQTASGTFIADASNVYVGKQLYVGFFTAGIQGNWDNISVEILPPTTQAPVFNPGGKYIPGPTPVTITSTTEGANIYYTLNGSEPTTSSTRYTGPVMVEHGTTLQAIAVGSDISLVTRMTYLQYNYAEENLVKNSDFESGYASWSFKDTGTGGDGGIVNMATLNPNDCFPIDTEHGNCFFYSNGVTAYQTLTDKSGSPVLLQAGKTYRLGAENGITTGLAGWGDDVFWARANIGRSIALFVVNDAGEWVNLYSLTMPDWVSRDQAGTWQMACGNFMPNASNAYLGKQLYIGIFTAGIQGNWDNISVTFQGPATNAPVFTPDFKYISGPMAITINSATEGAVIYYTLNGSVPTTSSTRYTGPVTVNNGTTLKAIAVATDTSWVTSETYVVPVTRTGNLVVNPGFEQGFFGWVGQDLEAGTVDTSIAIDTFPVNAEHGNHYLYCNKGTAYQALTDRKGAFLQLQAGTTYTVGADAGIPFYFANKDYTTFFDQANVERKIELFVIDDNNMMQSLCTVTMPDWTSKNQCGTWQTALSTFVADASNPYLGKQLYVRFTTSGIQASWDNIFVTAQEPATKAPVFTPGGKYISGPIPITITSSTVGAILYYTIDGSVPTTNSTRYTGPVTVSSNTTLKAIAVGTDTSWVTSTTFVVPQAYNRPEVILSGSVTIDGDLADWSGSTWTALDQDYDGDAADVAEAYYSAKWQSNKVYVAVKVHDTAHFFTDSYMGWDDRDAVEIYLHTDNNGGIVYPDSTTAQQYTIGITNSDVNKVWAVVGSNGSVRLPVGSYPGIGSAAGRVDGEWLYYEVAITPFTYLGLFETGNLSTSVTSQLNAGDVIGLDVCVVGNNAGTYTGMKSEHMMAEKFDNWTFFGLHKLMPNAPMAGDANSDGMVDVGDLGILAANYGKTTSATWQQGDFNGDGAVDVGDLGILAAHYGEGSVQSANFSDDYAKAFGNTVSDETESNSAADSFICGALGLPLISGLMLIGLLLLGSFKFEE